MSAAEQHSGCSDFIGIDDGINTSRTSCSPLHNSSPEACCSGTVGHDPGDGEEAGAFTNAVRNYDDDPGAVDFAGSSDFIGLEEVDYRLRTSCSPLHNSSSEACRSDACGHDPGDGVEGGAFTNVDMDYNDDPGGGVPKAEQSTASPFSEVALKSFRSLRQRCKIFVGRFRLSIDVSSLPFTQMVLRRRGQQAGPMFSL